MECIDLISPALLSINFGSTFWDFVGDLHVLFIYTVFFVNCHVLCFVYSSFCHAFDILMALFDSVWGSRLRVGENFSD